MADLALLRRKSKFIIIQTYVQYKRILNACDGKFGPRYAYVCIGATPNLHITDAKTRRYIQCVLYVRVHVCGGGGGRENRVCDLN